MEPYVLVVATRAPRADASVMASAVSSGHLICTKWTSAASRMPASAIAALTAFSTSRIWTIVPSSSDLHTRVLATPATRPRPGRGAPGTSRRTNTVTWGVMMPSVPPDMMNCTRENTSSGVVWSRAASSAAYADVAKPRLQSFTQPLPSVLPSTAITSRGDTVPSSMSLARPPTSSGPAVGSRWISMRCIVVSSRSVTRECGADGRGELGGAAEAREHRERHEIRGHLDHVRAHGQPQALHAELERVGGAEEQARQHCAERHPAADDDGGERQITAPVGHRV